MQNNKLFIWTSQYEEALQSTKTEVRKKTELLHPNFSKEFKIFTDALDLTYRRVIVQDKRLILYYSRKFTLAQQNYSVIEKELLAIVIILTENYILLLGQQLIVFIDYKTL